MFEFLAILGGAVLLTIIIVAVILVMFAFENFIEKKRRAYKIKHRFDKPPKAKCYCIDCARWDKKSSRCDRFDWYMADNWFCFDAEPRKKVE